MLREGLGLPLIAKLKLVVQSADSCRDNADSSVQCIVRDRFRDHEVLGYSN
jgi:hypothetical protein